MIPMEACKDRQPYRLRSRNLRLGVYSAATHGFLGIREKFGSRFLAEEFHWETGAPFGSAKPLEELPDRLPDEVEVKESLGPICLTCGVAMEYNGKDAWQHLVSTNCREPRPVNHTNAPLARWMKAMEAKYP